MNRLLVVIVVLLALIGSTEAQTITSVQGAVDNNVTITINGGGFGPAPTIIKYDNFETGVNGASVGNGWYTNGSNGSANVPLYSTEKVRVAGTDQVSVKHRFFNGFEFNSNLGILGLNTPKGWVSLWEYKIPGDASHVPSASNEPANGTYQKVRNSKFIWWASGSGDNQFTPIFRWDYQPDVNGDTAGEPGEARLDFEQENPFSCGGPDSTVTINLNQYLASYDLMPNAWHRWDLWVDQGTPGGSDGRLIAYLDGTIIADQTGLAVTGSCNFTKVFLGTWYFDASCSGIVDCANKRPMMVAYTDMAYVANSPARVELCTGSTWASRGTCEIQPASAWSDSQITTTIKQGSISDGTTGYLYVVNSALNPSVGFPVSIGPGPTNTNVVGPVSTNLSRLEISNKNDPLKPLLAPPRTTACESLKGQGLGSLCFDLDADTDADGKTGELKQCTGGVDATTGVCISWTAVGSGFVKPGGSIGQAQFNNGSGGFEGSSAFNFTVSGKVLTDSLNYVDVSLNGTTVERWPRDFDGSGSLTIYEDLIQPICSALGQGLNCAGTPRTFDLNGDGTSDGGGLVISLPAGRWVGSIADVKNGKIGTWKASNWTLRGAGKNSTYIAWTGTCADEDDGDTTTELGAHLNFSGANVTIEGLTLDGGSQRWQYTTNAFDANGDGTMDAGHCEMDTAAAGVGNTCSGKWCSRDSNQIISIGVNSDNFVVKDVVFINADRAGIFQPTTADGNGDGTANDPDEPKGLVVYNSSFIQQAEHAISPFIDGNVVSHSFFRRCGEVSKSCLVVGSGSVGEVWRGMRVASSLFEDCGGACIGWEFGAFTTEGMDVVGNTFTTRDGNQATTINALVNNAATANNIRGLNISGNTFSVSPAIGASPLVSVTAANPSANKITGLVFSNNTVKFVSHIQPNFQSGTPAISLSSVSDSIIQGNTIDITGDATGNAAPYQESCLVVGGSPGFVENVSVIGNSCVLRGTGAYGYGFANAQHAEIIDNTVNLVAASTTTTQQNYGFRIDGISRSKISNNRIIGPSSVVGSAVYGIFLANGTATANTIENNQCSSVTSCLANFIGGSFTENKISGNFSSGQATHSGGAFNGFTFSDNTSPVAGNNFVEGNFGEKGAVDGANAIAGNSFSLTAGHGTTWISDVDGNGWDSTSTLMLNTKSGLGFQGATVDTLFNRLTSQDTKASTPPAVLLPAHSGVLGQTTFTQTTATTVANQAAETTLTGAGSGSLTIPASELLAGTTIQVESRGFLSTDASEAPTFRIKLGGTTFCSFTPSALVSLTNRGFYLRCLITTTAAPGAAVATWGQGDGGVFTSSTAVSVMEAVSTTTTNVATNGALAVDVTIDWVDGAAANTATMSNLIIKLGN